MESGFRAVLERRESSCEGPATMRSTGGFVINLLNCVQIHFPISVSARDSVFSKEVKCSLHNTDCVLNNKNLHPHQACVYNPEP